MTKQEFSIPVYRTKDYTIFKKLDGNRNLYPNHVKRLVRAIKLNPEFTKISPLLVNEKNEVIDGQHRLAAFEEYASANGESPEVYYIVSKDSDLSTARRLNSTSKVWLPLDYAEAFAAEGNKNYKLYCEFSKKFSSQINHEVLEGVLSDSVSKSRNFRDGLFVVKVAKPRAEELIQNIIDASAFYHNWPNRSFAIAYLRVERSKLYSHERMIEQISKYKEALYNIPTRVNELAVGLNMVYNWKCADKLDLLMS